MVETHFLKPNFILVTAANDQSPSKWSKAFKGYPGMAIRQRIVSVVTSPAFQRETNVLTDNVYLTSREISVRISLFHSWLFI